MYRAAYSGALGAAKVASVPACMKRHVIVQPSKYDSSAAGDCTRAISIVHPSSASNCIVSPA